MTMGAEPGSDHDIEIVVVAAIAENGVIGNDGEMPWYYPEDLRRFKETTIGHPVIMGRHTFESIHDRLGEPLPGRTNVVLTTTPSLLPDGVVPADSIDAAIQAAAETGSETAYVI
ncbi:MAG: dihydrofolate reductase, partial [Halobacteriales archaeon]